MAEAHQRYERLAVGHVVGGLDEVDAARFRSHLLSCADCRTRIAELREIASTLAATEREERSARAGSTEVATRADEAAPPRVVDVAPLRSWPWAVVAIGLLPVLVLGALAWALWIRTENQLLAGLAEAQQSALELLATGDGVELTTSAGVDGIAASDASLVAVVLNGVQELDADEGLVLWLLDDAGVPVHVSTPLLRSRVAGGEVLLRAPRAVDAAELVVSLERIPSDLESPIGLRVASGPLEPLAGPPATGSG